MKKINLTQSGRSMIEMLGVLAVIGVLTVGGFSLISKVSKSHKTNVTIDEIGSFVNKARTVFREFAISKKNDTSEELVSFNYYLTQEKIYPSSVEPNEGGYFISNYDVKYTFKADSAHTPPEYFYVEISQIDDEMCMEIAQATWGSPAMNGYVGICVGSSCGDTGGVAGVAAANLGTNAAKGGAKLSLDGAATACSNGDTSTGNQIYLTFR